MHCAVFEVKPQNTNAMQQALAGSVCLLADLLVKHLKSGTLVREGTAYALEFKRGMFQAYRCNVDFTTNELKVSRYMPGLNLSGSAPIVSPTHLIWNLMSVFFAPDVMALSSACGTCKHKALNVYIMKACIR